MSSYQARSQGGPNGQTQFNQYNNHYQQQQQQQQPTAQQVYEQQFRQQQQQQQAYIQQLQLQQQLLMQQQVAIQQQAALRAALAGGNHNFQQQQQQGQGQYSSQNYNQVNNQHQYRQQQQQQQQQQQPRQQYPQTHEPRTGGRSVSAGRAAEVEQGHKANPLLASALARQAKRQSVNLDHSQAKMSNGVNQVRSRHSSAEPRPVQVVRTDSNGSTHHRRSSSGNSSHKSGSPEPPALILSRPGDPFPDTSGSETSSDGGLEGEINLLAEENEANNAQERRDKLAASFAGLSVRSTSPAGRASQASSLAAALGGRSTRQRPASLGLGLGQPPAQAQYDPHRAVSDNTNLSVFAASFVPLPPSPFPGQMFSPPTAHSAAFPANPNNALSRGKAPVKGGASATRQPKGPAQGSEGNFAQRLRRAAVAQLACVERAGRVM